MWVCECVVIGSLIHSSSFQQSVCRDHRCCAVIVLLQWMGENRVMQYAVIWCSWFTKPDSQMTCACVQFDCDSFSTVIPSLAAPFPTFPPLLNSVRLKSSSAMNLRKENKQKSMFLEWIVSCQLDCFLIPLLPERLRTSTHPSLHLLPLIQFIVPGGGKTCKLHTETWKTVI